MATEFRTFLRLLQLAGLVITCLGLLVTAVVAAWIGIQDVFSPVSLSAQLVGLSYLLAGIAGLAGVVGLAGIALLAGKTSMPWRKRIARLAN